MDRTELAWAAGFWDGEGSTWLTRSMSRITWSPQARINQSSTDGVPSVLVKFQAAVGMGRIHGPELDEGREPLYRWVLSSRREIEQISLLLEPWLGHVKRAQLADVLGRRPQRPATWAQIDPVERRAWTAGFWDGEGSVSLLKHRSHAGHFVPEAAATQSSRVGRPEVLERLHELAGGHVYGPYPQPPPWAPVYRWKLFRRDEIRAFFDLIWPRLGDVKRIQAERVMSVLDAQPQLPRGNPAWGNRKTHCVKGHAYVNARVRPFRGRGVNTEAPRESSKCLVCLREYAREQRRRQNERAAGFRRGSNAKTR